MWVGDIWQNKKDGGVFPLKLTLSAIYDEDGNVTNHLAIFMDMTQWKKKEDELKFLSNYDPLTSLPNRSLFLVYLSHALSYAKRILKPITETPQNQPANNTRSKTGNLNRQKRTRAKSNKNDWKIWGPVGPMAPYGATGRAPPSGRPPACPWLP